MSPLPTNLPSVTQLLIYQKKKTQLLAPSQSPKSCGDCFSVPKPGCNNQTCSLLPANTVTQSGTIGELAQDVVAVQSTDGKTAGRVVSVQKFLFTCGATLLLEGLGGGVKGMAGLGRTRVSLPSQFSAAFSFHRKFAICSISSTMSNGVVFFGDGPYVLLPGIDISKQLIYTPLILNRVSTAPASFEGQPSSDYFIGVKGNKINDKLISLNKTLLSINKEGRGGTNISTVTPYTVMGTSIYNAFVNTFVREMLPSPRVRAVAPFGFCFNATGIPSTRVGPPVPTIDLLLQSNSVFWRIFGANLMVWVRSDVNCLGFVDGGTKVSTSIVIGRYQLEDNLLQFEPARSRLGFSSSLLFRQTTCANFNFTSSD